MVISSSLIWPRSSRPTVAERSYQPYWPVKTDDNVFEAPRSPKELAFVSKDWRGSEMEMAPEILRHDYYSFGVDYWSAGVTLYAMVTGRASRPIIYHIF
jgi:serine/threonine protein kinase